MSEHKCFSCGEEAKYIDNFGVLVCESTSCLAEYAENNLSELEKEDEEDEE